MKGCRALRRQILNRLLLDAYLQASNSERIRIVRELGKINRLYPKRAKRRGKQHARPI